MGILINETFLQRMNGTTDNASKRTAGGAYENGNGYTDNLRMDGNPWTTLCPAPLAVGPVYPASAVTEKRKGFGCILLDTALNNTPPATGAVIKDSGGATISDTRWLKDADGNFYGIGFTFDKTSDNSSTTMKAVSDKIRNKGAGGRAMDGDGVQPNEDDKQWSF